MSAGETCFDTAINQEDRQDLAPWRQDQLATAEVHLQFAQNTVEVNLNGETYPVGIWVNDWAAGYATSIMVQILVQANYLLVLGCWCL